MNAFASYHVQKALAIKQDFLVLYYREIKYTECRVMKYIKSIFAVSIVAMAVVGNARASIVSQTNIVGGSNVSVNVPKSGTNAGKVVISATDTNTTYTTGTTTYSGTTKLYTGTGSATDGTLTQKAITDALRGKANTENLGDLASLDIITSDKVMNGAITSDKIHDGAIEEVNLSDAVKTKLNATVQKIDSAAAADGKYVTNLTKDGTTVKLETAYVQIPVGSVTAPTSMASIWVE